MWLKIRGPFKVILSFGNMVKVTQDQVKWVQFFQQWYIFGQKSLQLSAVRECSLSWCKLHLSRKRFFIECAAINIQNLKKEWLVDHSGETCSLWTVEKSRSAWFWTFDIENLTFFSPRLFHWKFWDFISMSYWRTHLS